MPPCMEQICYEPGTPSVEAVYSRAKHLFSYGFLFAETRMGKAFLRI